MNPQYERFNDRLEQSIKGRISGVESDGDAGRRGDNTEGNDLLELARQFQAMPHLRIDPVFATQLERRVLRHALTRPWTVRDRSRAPWWRPHRVLALAISVFLVLLLLSVGVLTVPARIILPGSPFTSPGNRQTFTQSTPTVSPVDLAAVDLQTARARLLALQQVANSTQTSAYVQDLASFDTQLARATGSISALSASDEKALLTNQLAQLRKEARQKLRGWLRLLTPTGSAATTSELGRLGESIPQVSSASIVLPSHPRGNATVRVMGSGFQQGARLLVDGKLVYATSALQNGQVVFVLTWTSEKHPHTLGIVNPDGTVAQTDKVTVTTARNNGNNNGSGEGSNGNGQGK